MKATDFKWAKGDAWASHMIEKDGKFYFFTTVRHNEEKPGFAIGVAVSDSPTGPLSDQTLSQLGWSTARLDASFNPVHVLVSNHRQLHLPGTHTSREKALELQLPVGVSARFDKPGLEHFYQFSAQKGHYYRFEINSQRRGFAVDLAEEVCPQLVELHLAFEFLREKTRHQPFPAFQPDGHDQSVFLRFIHAKPLVADRDGIQ